MVFLSLVACVRDSFVASTLASVDFGCGFEVGVGTETGGGGGGRASGAGGAG